MNLFHRAVRTDQATTDEPLWQLVYVSTAKPGLRFDDVEMILRSSRRRNELLEVTGMLMLVDGTFCQILEGSREHVIALFERIKVDRRNHGTRLLQLKPIERRSFPEWSMGPASRSLREFADAVSVDDFLRGVRPAFALSDERIRALLALIHAGGFAQKDGAPRDAPTMHQHAERHWEHS